MSDWKDVWDREGRATKERLQEFDRDFVIDFTRNSVRGALPNGNLAPLDFNSPILFTGILTVDKGGTSADFSATGPGVVKQTSVGAALTVGGVEYTDVDWASGTADHGQPLIYDNTGPTAEFGALNLASSLVTTGLLPGSRGGTGVNNGSNQLTIPATGTAALLGLAQTFSAAQTVNTGAAGALTIGASAIANSIVSVRNNLSVQYAFTIESDSAGRAFRVLTPDWVDSSTGSRLIMNFGAGSGNTHVALAAAQGGGLTGGPLVLQPTAGWVLVGKTSGLSGAGDLDINGIFNTSQYIQMTEITAPAAGAANTGRLFLRDNGAGKTQLCVIFNTGAIQVIATQP